jgi:hypothetical protein
MTSDDHVTTCLSASYAAKQVADRNTGEAVGAKLSRYWELEGRVWVGHVTTCSWRSGSRSRGCSPSVHTAGNDSPPGTSSLYWLSCPNSRQPPTSPASSLSSWLTSYQHQAHGEHSWAEQSRVLTFVGFEVLTGTSMKWRAAIYIYVVPRDMMCWVCSCKLYCGRPTVTIPAWCTGITRCLQSSCSCQQNHHGVVWNGLIWLRMGTNGAPLWTLKELWSSIRYSDILE